MGFFDLFKARASTPKSAAASKPATTGSSSTPQESKADAFAPEEEPGYPEVPGLLVQARALLGEKDLGGALDIFERLLRRDGDNAKLLLEISAELGQHGHVQQIIEIIAPRYDAPRHGGAIGINVIQAYLSAGDVTGAKHLLGILRDLKNADLQERLIGFEKAIAELSELQGRKEALAGGADSEEQDPATVAKVNLVTISKPIWFYGLEPLAEALLPTKGANTKRVIFTQLSLPGQANLGEMLLRPEDELGRLTRAIPLWLSETLFFSASYTPLTAIGILEAPGKINNYALLGTEWTVDNLRQLLNGSTEPVDFVFTGALRRTHETYELSLRLWDVKKFRERKHFTVTWTPATKDEELRKFNEMLRLFMEHVPCPAGQGLAFAPVSAPSAWLATQGASLSLFLSEKQLIPASMLAPVSEDLVKVAGAAASSEAASLAWISLRKRALALGLVQEVPQPVLFESPLVKQALGLA